MEIVKIDTLKPIGPSLSVLVISSRPPVFALMHGVPMAMITAFFFGTCAAALIRWHQSLWASVALHIANNTVVSLVLLFIYFTGTNVLG